MMHASHTLLHLLIFAAINLAATTLSGAAGGGGSLIGVPVLILLGLSPATAIASGKFSSLGLATGGSARFFKEKLTDRRTVLTFASIGAVGAATGSLFLVHVGISHQAVLQQATGWVILLVGIPFLYIRGLGVTSKIRSTSVRSLGYVLILLAAAISGTFSAGMGAIQTMVLLSCFGMTALVASATRRAVQLVTAIISLLILMFAGIPDYHYGLVALVTSLIGGFVGAHIAIKKGNKFVINLFAVVSAILAIQLLWR